MVSEKRLKTTEKILREIFRSAYPQYGFTSLTMRI
jgi:hypothetical protein